MRYHVLKFDIWLCLLFSVFLSMGAEKIANKILPQKYEETIYFENGELDEFLNRI